MIKQWEDFFFFLKGNDQIENKIEDVLFNLILKKIKKKKKTFPNITNYYNIYNR